MIKVCPFFSNGPRSSFDTEKKPPIFSAEGFFFFVNPLPTSVKDFLFLPGNSSTYYRSPAGTQALESYAERDGSSYSYVVCLLLFLRNIKIDEPLSCPRPPFTSRRSGLPYQQLFSSCLPFTHAWGKGAFSSRFFLGPALFRRNAGRHEPPFFLSTATYPSARPSLPRVAAKLVPPFPLPPVA